MVNQKQILNISVVHIIVGEFLEQKEENLSMLIRLSSHFPSGLFFSPNMCSLKNFKGYKLGKKINIFYMFVNKNSYIMGTNTSIHRFTRH
jgi:hypothetical protein